MLKDACATLLNHTRDVVHELLLFMSRTHASSSVAHGAGTTGSGGRDVEHLRVRQSRLRFKQRRGVAACTMKGKKATQHV